MTDTTPDEWEGEYEDGTPHWAKDMTPSLFAKDFIKELEKRGLNSVLEIGCGNGRDSIFFAKSGLQVTSIDVSPSAVRLALYNIERAGVKASVQVGNVENLIFPSDRFDSVYSLSVLHSTDLPRSLSEIYRVLKPKGYAFIHIYGSTAYRNKGVEEKISLDSYIHLLKSIGFVVWDIYTEQEPVFDTNNEKHKIYVVFLSKG